MIPLEMWTLVLLALPSLALALPRPSRTDMASRGSSTRRSFDVPLVRREGRRLRPRGASGKVTLGDSNDMLYTVSVGLGNRSMTTLLDTGSSDLWVISDACSQGMCASSSSERYPSSELKPTGANVTLLFGDSKTGTRASGPIGKDTAVLAGIEVPDQAFVAVDFTNNMLVADNAGINAAGLLGLAFPTESRILSEVVSTQGKLDVNTFIHGIAENGPLLSRLALNGALEQPMFTVSLQRTTMDVGGNPGMLTVGKLPDGVDNSSLTWVPVKKYGPDVGGITPPTFAPGEVYPLRWEVEIEAVFLDGQKLADTTKTGNTPSGNSLSALIDTGNSILRGPSDVVSTILSTVSPAYASNPQNLPTFPCAQPHTLAFQIGGAQFPVDPRDFAMPLAANCMAGRLAPTDAPRAGATFAWSLGDPFFRSTLVAFYFGNLTHPSVDPPRMGFMSTVQEAGDRAVGDAQRGQF